jgi:hypothetical protein
MPLRSTSAGSTHRSPGPGAPERPTAQPHRASSQENPAARPDRFLRTFVSTGQNLAEANAAFAKSHSRLLVAYRRAMDAHRLTNQLSDRAADLVRTSLACLKDLRFRAAALADIQVVAVDLDRSGSAPVSGSTH